MFTIQIPRQLRWSTNSLKWCFGLVLGCLLLGCGRTVSRSDLLGTYVANYAFATETLLVHDQGHFTQTIKVHSDGRVAVTNGTWRFDPKERDVIFSEQFMVVADGFGEMVTNFDHPTREAIVILPVRRYFGKIQIGAHPGVPYKRQKPKSIH